MNVPWVITFFSICVSNAEKWHHMCTEYTFKWKHFTAFYTNFYLEWNGNVLNDWILLPTFFDEASHTLNWVYENFQTLHSIPSLKFNPFNHSRRTKFLFQNLLTLHRLFSVWLFFCVFLSHVSFCYTMRFCW